ncbi:MAG: ABC transporter ATP-binding protein [Selenomonadales bacterium]|nr:ABC transporter ATP-binding protein [Selenomonadales bacterium]
MVLLKQKIKTIKRALLLGCRAAPGEVRLLLVLNLLLGVTPIIILYTSKIVIDEVTQLAGRQGLFAHLGSLLPQAILAFVACIFIMDTVETVRGLEIDNFRDRVGGEARRQLLAKVAGFDDLSMFENPEALNTLQLAEKGADHLWRLVTAIGRMLIGLFAFVPAFLLTATIAWWVPPVLFLTALPTVFVVSRVEDFSWDVEESQAENVRYMKLYERILLTEIYAKEVRLFNLPAFFLGHWNVRFSAMFSAMKAARSRGTWMLVAWSVVGTLGAAIPYVFVVDGALRGAYTLGDLALFAGLIFQVRRSLELMIFEGGDLYQAAQGAGPLFDVLDMESALAREPVPQGSSGSQAYGVRFSHVSFSYPTSDRTALEDINLSISPGETVVLVGENGAGKTTLTKLLCRLYDPNQGEITWDGENIRSLDIGELRKRIAVVCQDYAHFPVTVRENIGFGDLSQMHHDATLLAVAGEVGLDRLVEALPDSLDTPLGTILEGGTDLSSGQWQRLALARALLRQPKAQLMILDEPTAAIDPQSEHEVLATLRHLARDKMALIVTHRMPLARSADRILVLKHGRIVEQGSHTELMSARGVYYTMFTRQASSYLPT